MDIHTLQGVSAEELAKAHEADLATQRKYGVEYLKYWFNDSCGKAFCLFEAPSAEAAAQVHCEAHGQMAEKIIEIQPELADGFLGGGEVNAAGAVLVPGGGPDARDSAIRTVLFTDIVDSTLLTQNFGDKVAMEFLHIHDVIVRNALVGFQGREVKHTGDGIMASFISSAAAVRCAARIQRDLALRRQERSDHPIKVRIGGAAGEPVEHENDIFGATVQLASRLCSHAEPDQILVSSVVADLCMGKGLLFRSLGEVSLKGFEQPVRVHAVDFASEMA